MINWQDFIDLEKDKTYFKQLEIFLDKEYKSKTIYPKRSDILNRFKLTRLDQVKVVIIGQDPYHQIGQSHGLCFSVLQGKKTPPSLRNIFNELERDLNIDHRSNTDLSGWARQGILLLNKVLTVQESKPNSHANQGWEIFTDNVISQLNLSKTPIIFLLWGAYAQKAKKLITNKKHYILESSHPSPLSAYHSFNESRPFSKINEILLNEGLKPIDWSL